MSSKIKTKTQWRSASEEALSTVLWLDVTFMSDLIVQLQLAGRTGDLPSVSVKKQPSVRLSKAKSLFSNHSSSLEDLLDHQPQTFSSLTANTVFISRSED